MQKREAWRDVTVFLSTYVNNIDKKGRVSVPAPFRAEMMAQSRQSVVIFPSRKEGFLFVWGYDDFLAFAKRINSLPPMSKERQRLSRTILAASKNITLDGDGRMILPADLLEVAKVEDKLLFAGQGEYFTLWNPELYEQCQTADEEHYDDDLETLSEGWAI